MAKIKKSQGPRIQVCLVDKGTPVIRYDSSVKEQPIFLVSDKFEQCINISELGNPSNMIHLTPHDTVYKVRLTNIVASIMEVV